ncbi:conserved oligomeric Golgi complex subunit 8-like protein, partial [Dinothrombium tinctorium]
IDEIEQRLDTFIGKIPNFVHKANVFSEEAKSIAKRFVIRLPLCRHKIRFLCRWREASLMLSKHPQVLEFLEIPQLMDTCVRNNCYEEALQLYAYVHKLERRYGNSIPLISNVCREANECKEYMTNQLTKELYTNTQLPNCLKIINCLRKLEAFTETELRIKFLTARDSWLQSLIKEIPTMNPLVYISKLTEICRVNLFDIVTQYRAVFAGEDIAPSYRLYIQFSNEMEFKENAILPSWISYKISQFLLQLKQNLNRCISIEVGQYYPIEAVIDPCFYFGLSMSRIGADFRPLLVPIFCEALFKRFEKVTEKSVLKFNKSMENYTLKMKPLDNQPKASTEQDLSPPLSLLEFVPLAQLCNDILTGFNEFRQLIITGVMNKITKCLAENLFRVSLVIKNYFKTEESSFTTEERQIFDRFCDRYANDLLPYLQKCLNACCPPTQIASILGISLLEFHKLKKTEQDITFVNLDIEYIVQPIKDLIFLHIVSEEDENAEIAIKNESDERQ